MVGLRVCHNLLQRIRVPIIACSVAVFTNVALAGHWKVEDTQYNSDPDFEYKIFLYEIVGGNPNYLNDYLYTYAGPVDYEYSWTVGPYSVFNPQAIPVYCEVWNRYGGSGPWYPVTSFYAEWVP